MPNTHTTLKSLFDDVADAIREKDSTSDIIIADTFPDRILAIPSGGDECNMYAGSDAPSSAVSGDLWVDTSDEAITVEPITIISNGTTTAPTGKAYSPITVNVSTKNVQANTTMKHIKATTMTTTNASITVSKTGTYKCSWVHFAQAAGSSSQNYSSQLYVAGSARGSSHYAPIYSNTDASNFVCTESNISLTSGQTVEVWARSRGTSYYINAGFLVIEEQ